MESPRNLRRPHDEFIKSMLFETTVAKDFFEAHLPAEILQQVKLDTLELTHGSFVDPELKMRHTDVLYKVELKQGGEGYIFLLVEHYSSVDPVMAFRTMNYVMRILDKHVKDAQNAKINPLPLPFVFPVLFFNGEKAYKGERCLFNLFGDYNEEVKRIFTEDLDLVDVSVEANEEIRGQKWASLLSWCMRYSAQRDFLAHLPEFGRLIEDIIENLGWSEADTNRIKIMLKYILMSLNTSAQAGALLKAFQEELPKELESTVATVGEQLIAQGKLEGLQEGKLEGLHEGELKGIQRTMEAIAMLKEGLDIEIIRKKTTLDIETIKALREQMLH